MKGARQGVQFWQLMYPGLMDADAMKKRLQAGMTHAEICKEIGCGESSLRKALKYHNMPYPLYVKRRRK